jgi:hypothetical protein
MQTTVCRAQGPPSSKTDVLWDCATPPLSAAEFKGVLSNPTTIDAQYLYFQFIFYTGNLLAASLAKTNKTHTAPRKRFLHGQLALSSQSSTSKTTKNRINTTIYNRNERVGRDFFIAHYAIKKSYDRVPWIILPRDNDSREIYNANVTHLTNQN